MSFYQIVKSLERFTNIEMSLTEPNWWNPIPAEPGWYLIWTNTPIKALEALPAPAEGLIYDIPSRMHRNSWLLTNGLAIQPATTGELYVVYSGQQTNLRSRAREHTHGNPGTGCLRLSEYQQQIRQFRWQFSYLTCESAFPGCNGNEGLRQLVEQTWRALNGWPVLCLK